MTIDELIALLSDYRDELGGDTEVRLLNQPAWPFEYSICGLAPSDDHPVLYIVEGDQLGYGDKRGWEEARREL